MREDELCPAVQRKEAREVAGLAQRADLKQVPAELCVLRAECAENLEKHGGLS